MACFDFITGGEPPKVEKPEPAPTPNDTEVGDAELKRKRAASVAFGRKSTIATSGMGVTGSPGIKVSTTGMAN